MLWWWTAFLESKVFNVALKPYREVVEDIQTMIAHGDYVRKGLHAGVVAIAIVGGMVAVFVVPEFAALAEGLIAEFGLPGFIEYAIQGYIGGYIGGVLVSDPLKQVERLGTQLVFGDPDRFLTGYEKKKLVTDMVAKARRLGKQVDEEALSEWVLQQKEYILSNLANPKVQGMACRKEDFEEIWNAFAKGDFLPLFLHYLMVSAGRDGLNRWQDDLDESLNKLSLLLEVQKSGSKLEPSLQSPQTTSDPTSKVGFDNVPLTDEEGSSEDPKTKAKNKNKVDDEWELEDSAAMGRRDSELPPERKSSSEEKPSDPRRASETPARRRSSMVTEPSSQRRSSVAVISRKISPEDIAATRVISPDVLCFQYPAACKNFAMESEAQAQAESQAGLAVQGMVERAAVDVDAMQEAREAMIKENRKIARQRRRLAQQLD